MNVAATWALLRCDLLLALRRPGEILHPIAFFSAVATLFPLASGAGPEMLRRMAPGALWIAALLAATLAAPRLFAEDYADGSLEQLALASTPLAPLLAARAAAHWLVSGAPLVLLGPVFGAMFGLDPAACAVLGASLLLGIPVLSLLGALAAALTLGVRPAAFVAALLVLPLYVPTLVFGAGAVNAAQSGLDPLPHLQLLGALSILAAFYVPIACAAAVRLVLET